MSCPPTPASDRESDLGFRRRRMVSWFAPLELAESGLRAVLAAVFGAYADKREMQAALEDPRENDELANEEEVWIDYTADLGDGWNSTYAVARTIAREELDLKETMEPGATPHPTCRGQLLILGGDEVYPTPSRKAYRDRFVGPYTAALPCVLDREPPSIFAIPGNHDWYDGLTSFVRLFCQGRWIGGWRTRQSRSYFAIRLPHNWWIWGIDIQLQSDIDGPQLEYFRAVATGSLDGHEPQDDYLEGHRIILCTAKPSWVKTATDGAGAYHNLDYFERKIIRKNGGKLVLTLAGDLHHYTRYSNDQGSQKITAGGGGAYLYGTHELPKRLVLGEEELEYSRTRRSFPDNGTSRRLALGALRFPFLRPNWTFTGFVGLLYLLYAWIVQSSSKRLERDFMEALSVLPIGPSGALSGLREWIGVAAHSPGAVVFTVAVVLGLVAFCDARKPWIRWPVGLAHGLAHVALNLVLIWAIAYVNLVVLGMRADSAPQVLLFTAETFVVGAPVGGLLVAIYLIATNRFLGLHINEVFVTQAIPDYKNFVRMHLGEDGRLIVYPVGIRRSPRKWRLNKEAAAGEPWFDPADAEIRAELIEGPIVVEG